jgi:K(+)-stimulated pyrophosphate-energized sodium pump
MIRNLAVIADNVGDNVGDCAGMAADLFGPPHRCRDDAGWRTGVQGVDAGIAHPLAIPGVSILVDAGRFFVKARDGGKIMNALYRGLRVAGVISLVLFWPVTSWILGPVAAAANVTVMNLYLAAVVGLVLTAALVYITEYYTGTQFSPVKYVAQATTGHATNIIAGIAVSLKACAWPVLAICAAIIASYWLAGLYGIAVAATAMLSMTGIIVALDAYGPITDNAGGIAEMADMPKEVRAITDPLDAVGNTTKAVTKGYAIGSAGLAAWCCSSITPAACSSRRQCRPVEPHGHHRLFIGGPIPFPFGAMAMEAVGRAVGSVVNEGAAAPRDPRDHGVQGEAGLQQGGRHADQRGDWEMMIPSLLPVLVPIVVGAILGPAALGGKRWERS